MRRTFRSAMTGGALQSTAATLLAAATSTSSNVSISHDGSSGNGVIGRESPPPLHVAAPLTISISSSSSLPSSSSNGVGITMISSSSLSSGTSHSLAGHHITNGHTHVNGHHNHNHNHGHNHGHNGHSHHMNHMGSHGSISSLPSAGNTIVLLPPKPDGIHHHGHTGTGGMSSSSTHRPIVHHGDGTGAPATNPQLVIGPGGNAFLPPASEAKSPRVYVGNLNFSTTWQELKEHMRGCGDVRRVDIIQFPNGRSKGCAVVEFGDQDSATTAIKTLSGTQLAGRKIFVREDREEKGFSTVSRRQAPPQPSHPVSLPYMPYYPYPYGLPQAFYNQAYNQVPYTLHQQLAMLSLQEPHLTAAQLAAAAQSSLGGTGGHDSTNHHTGGGNGNGRNNGTNNHSSNNGNHSNGHTPSAASAAAAAAAAATSNTYQSLQPPPSMSSLAAHAVLMNNLAAAQAANAGYITGVRTEPSSPNLTFNNNDENDGMSPIPQSTAMAARYLSELERAAMYMAPLRSATQTPTRFDGGDDFDAWSPIPNRNMGEVGSQIYVGNLSWNTKWQELRDMFSIYGEVLLAEVVEDQVARRHKGFALVRFARASEADAAIAGHNGAELHGRKLLVRKDTHFVPSPAVHHLSAHIRSAASVPESAAAMVLASPPMSAAPSPLSPHPPRHVRFPTSGSHHNYAPPHEPSPPSLPGTPNPSIMGTPMMMPLMPTSLRDPLIATPGIGIASWTPPSPAPRRFAPSKRATLLQQNAAAAAAIASS